MDAGVATHRRQRAASRFCKICVRENLKAGRSSWQPLHVCSPSSLLFATVLSAAALSAASPAATHVRHFFALHATAGESWRFENCARGSMRPHGAQAISAMAAASTAVPFRPSERVGRPCH